MFLHIACTALLFNYARTASLFSYSQAFSLQTSVFMHKDVEKYTVHKCFVSIALFANNLGRVRTFWHGFFSSALLRLPHYLA